MTKMAEQPYPLRPLSLSLSSLPPGGATHTYKAYIRKYFLDFPFGPWDGGLVVPIFTPYERGKGKFYYSYRSHLDRMPFFLVTFVLFSITHTCSLSPN